MSRHEGSCLCEGVHFAVEGEPEKVFICYCSHCMKNAGGPGQIMAKFPKEQVKVKQGLELIKTWVLNDTMSGSEKHKLFCGRCGCTLWTIPMSHGGTHFIVRTSLIDNGLEIFKPKAEFFASRKVDGLLDGLKSFDTIPGR